MYLSISIDRSILKINMSLVEAYYWTDKVCAILRSSEVDILGMISTTLVPMIISYMFWDSSVICL